MVGCEILGHVVEMVDDVALGAMLAQEGGQRQGWVGQVGGGLSKQVEFVEG